LSDEPRLAITPRKRGRPRKHESAAARVRAFREAQSLCKVTIDVPAQYAEQLRAYARLLRVTARAERLSLTEGHFEAELPSIFPFGHAELYRSINAGRMAHPASWRIHRDTYSFYYHPRSWKRPLNWDNWDRYAQNFSASVSVVPDSLGGYAWSVRPWRNGTINLGNGRVPNIAAGLILAEITMLAHLTEASPSTQPVQTS
jgi:hypothetical protein